jgi:hypothetical protein
VDRRAAEEPSPQRGLLHVRPDDDAERHRPDEDHDDEGPDE